MWAVVFVHVATVALEVTNEVNQKCDSPVIQLDPQGLAQEQPERELGDHRLM